MLQTRVDGFKLQLYDFDFKKKKIRIINYFISYKHNLFQIENDERVNNKAINQLPSKPGRPASPLKPIGPGGPDKPASPFGPALPGIPGKPFSPFVPGNP